MWQGSCHPNLVVQLVTGKGEERREEREKGDKEQEKRIEKREERWEIGDRRKTEKRGERQIDRHTNT